MSYKCFNHQNTTPRNKSATTHVMLDTQSSIQTYNRHSLHSQGLDRDWWSANSSTSNNISYPKWRAAHHKGIWRRRRTATIRWATSGTHSITGVNGYEHASGNSKSIFRLSTGLHGAAMGSLTQWWWVEWTREKEPVNVLIWLSDFLLRSLETIPW